MADRTLSAATTAAQARRRRCVDRLDIIRDRLAAEALLIQRETRNGWPIEAATALREANDTCAEARDLIEALDD